MTQSMTSPAAQSMTSPAAPPAPDTRATRVHVPLGERAYDIFVGRGLLGEAGSRIAALGGRAAAIVTDTHVGPLYADLLAASLDAQGLPSRVITLAPGEATKSYGSLAQVCDAVLVRLAFSIMIQSDAEVLLIDEVLAVGDASFQQKCKDVFHEIRGSDRTVVLVTHDMSAVEQYCHRAMLLDRGSIAAIGDPDEVAHRYLRLNFAKPTGAAEELHPVAPEGSEVHLVDAWLESGGERTTNVEQGEPLTFEAVFTAPNELPGATFGFIITNENAIDVGGFGVSIGADDVIPAGRADPGARRAREPVRPGALLGSVLGPPEPLPGRAGARLAADPGLRRLRDRVHGRPGQGRQARRARGGGPVEGGAMSAPSQASSCARSPGPRRSAAATGASTSCCG